MISVRFARRTTIQSRRTIPLSPENHTMTRTSGRPHFQAVPLLSKRSGHSRKILQTDFPRNSTAAHGGHTPDPHTSPIRGTLPAPAKTAGH